MTNAGTPRPLLTAEQLQEEHPHSRRSLEADLEESANRNEQLSSSRPRSSSPLSLQSQATGDAHQGKSADNENRTEEASRSPSDLDTSPSLVQSAPLSIAVTAASESPIVELYGVNLATVPAAPLPTRTLVEEWIQCLRDVPLHIFATDTSPPSSTTRSIRSLSPSNSDDQDSVDSETREKADNDALENFLCYNPLPTQSLCFSIMVEQEKVPQPGPAKLTKNADLDAWLDAAKRNKFLPERVMKQLFEMCKELLMEESNTQPVSTPVTICGDIHGQFYDLLELLRVAGGMPGEDNIESSGTANRAFSPEDIEPPTEITDPKLKKKLRNSPLASVAEGENTTVSGVTDDDDDEEEHRGRSRSVGTHPDAIKEGCQGLPGNQNFIFMGDFVDRGYFSLETLSLLLCLKARYPHRITLIRGNHESRQITQVYGFYEECHQKYGNPSVWKAACQVFDFLPLAALVDGKVLCVHGGLSPEIRTLDQVRVVARAQEIPHEGAFCDLVWSDPEEVETWAVSPRGAGWLFGDKVATEFNHVNDLQLIARAHQLVNEGFKWHFKDRSVVTVWSAPNYCYRCGNVASIMNMNDDLNPKFNIFSAVPNDMRAVPASTGRRNDYFL